MRFYPAVELAKGYAPHDLTIATLEGIGVIASPDPHR